MDIIGKILQALLGGERPRTWIDLLIVLAVCGTYAVTQAMRFLHHQRHRQAVQSATPQQLAALGTADRVQPPKSAAALALLILAFAGNLGSSAIHPPGDTELPLCFVRNRNSVVAHSPCARPSLTLGTEEY